MDNNKEKKIFGEVYIDNVKYKINIEKLELYIKELGFIEIQNPSEFDEISFLKCYQNTMGTQIDFPTSEIDNVFFEDIFDRLHILTGLELQVLYDSFAVKIGKKSPINVTTKCKYQLADECLFNVGIIIEDYKMCNNPEIEKKDNCIFYQSKNSIKNGI